MKRLLPRLAVLALAFAFGVAASVVWNSKGQASVNAPDIPDYKVSFAPVALSLTCELHGKVMRPRCVSHDAVMTFGTTYPQQLARMMLFPNFYSHRAGAERCERGGESGTFHYVCPKCRAAKAAWESRRR